MGRRMTSEEDDEVEEEASFHGSNVNFVTNKKKGEVIKGHGISS